MRSSIGILAATLALTVFLTSLVMERPGVSGGPGSNRSLGRKTYVEPATTELADAAGNAQGEADTPADVAELLDQGWNFYEAGNASGALAIFRAAQQKAPQEARVVEALGTVCFATGDYAAAERYLLNHLNQHAEDVTARARLAMAQMRQQKFGPALLNLQAVLQQEPRDGALHFAAACASARLADPERALYHLEYAQKQLGAAFLAHVSDPNLDSLRESPRFQRLVDAALRNYRQRGMTASAGVPAPAAQ